MARSTVALLVAVVLVVLGVPARPAHPAQRGAPDPPAQPGGHVLLGAQVVADQPGLHAWRDAAATLETRLGRDLDLSWHARPWTRGLPRRRLSDDLAAGRIPVVAWTDVDAPGIAGGEFDQRLDRDAQMLAALGKPVLLAPLPPALDGEGEPTDYVAAFQRLSERLAAAGADQAQLVWCPSAESFRERGVDRWYPGDDVVDWVCARHVEQGTHAAAPGEALAPFWEWTQRRDRPALLAIAARDAEGGAQWIERLHQGLRERVDRATGIGTGLEALVWLDETPDAAFRSLRALARDQRFQPPRRARGPLSVREGVLLGAHAKDAPEYTPQEAQRATAELERAVGRRLDIAHAFYPWDRPFPTDFERWSLSEGRIPMVSWNGTDVTTIVAGAHDAMIRERAEALAALDAPVLLRWFWEMDGRRKADRARSPAEYIAAWHHIRAIFADSGADQVAWVWCPNAVAFETGEAAAWYPGDDAVDWLCADGYNMAGAQAGAARESLYQLFDRFHAWGQQRGKPLMIGETGALEGDPGRKAAWQASAARDLRAWLPNVQAYVHFDAVDYGTGWDWRVDTSPSSLAAFRAMANDPYFDSTSTAGPPARAGAGATSGATSGDDEHRSRHGSPGVTQLVHGPS